MLDTLYIENIAVIEKTTIDFTGGFNVLTGETGAGKSIVIDSINAILGNRTSKELIRTGAKKASVCAQFSNIPKEVREQLEKMGCINEDDGDSLVISREISSSGKNVCRVNCVPVPVSALKELGARLVDIHGQHESYELFSGERHRAYIDDYANTSLLLGEYREIFHSLKDLKHRLDKVESDDNERERRIDILKYRIKEIERADIFEGELEDLKEERLALRNSGKITSAVATAYSLLDGDEDMGALSSIHSAAHSLEEIAPLFKQAGELSQRLDSAYYEIDDCMRTLSSLLSDRDDGEQRLDEVEQRLAVIERIMKKYGPEYSDVLKSLESDKEELEALESYEENMEVMLDEYNELAQQALELAGEISQMRRVAAEEFVEAVQTQLSELDMPNVHLVVNIERTKLTENGIDKIELLISANPGEEPKPVSKIASGGELSRIMLSIKNVLSDLYGASTMIFDEVDAGISGSAAQRVGLKLKSVSSGRQVICVTHQAQIAALADSHYLIKKDVKGDKTFTSVFRLNFEQRKYELARIIGGINITDITLKHAEEMLNLKTEN